MFCHEYKSIFIGMFRIKVGDSSFPAENGQCLIKMWLQYYSARQIFPVVHIVLELPVILLGLERLRARLEQQGLE